MGERVTMRLGIGCILLMLLVPVLAVALAGCELFRLLPALHPTPHPQHLRPLWTLQTHTNQPDCLAYSPEKNAFILKTDQGIEMHNAATGKLISRFHSGGDFVAVSRDGKVLVESSGRTVKLWSVDSHRTTRSFKTAAKVHSAALSPDGRWLAVLDARQKLTVWRTTSTTPVRSLDASQQGSHFQGAAFSPDGKTLAVEAGNSHVYIYAVPTGKLERTLDSGDRGPPDQDNFFLAYSPDGRFLMTVGTGSLDVETSTHVWSASNYRQVAELEYADIVSVACSPDSSRLVTGGMDGATEIWDTATWQNTYTLDPASEKETESNMAHVAFAGDNRTAASEDENGIVRVWLISPEQHFNHTTVNVRRRG